VEQRIGVTEEDSEYQEFERNEIQQVLMNAITKLPEKSRLPFMMSRFEELTYNEIADRLNISVKTVESHMGRALKLLRESLQVTI